MADTTEPKKLGEILQALKEKVKALKIEVYSVESLDTGGGDLASRVEITKNENETLLKEIQTLKDQFFELKNEEGNLKEETQAGEIDEILTTDDKFSQEKAEQEKAAQEKAAQEQTDKENKPKS